MVETGNLGMRDLRLLELRDFSLVFYRLFLSLPWRERNSTDELKVVQGESNEIPDSYTRSRVKVLIYVVWK